MIESQHTALVGISSLSRENHRVDGVDADQHLHLNVQDVSLPTGIGKSVGPISLLASPAAFNRGFDKWANDIVNTPYLKAAMARKPGARYISIEGELVAPVPHNRLSIQAWGQSEATRPKNYLAALGKIDGAIKAAAGVCPVWYGATQIIPQYVRPAVSEHENMRASLGGWYAGRSVMRCQSFYRHKDGPDGADRREWIACALSMHHAAIGCGEYLTVFLSPVIERANGDSGDDFPTMTPEEYATDLAIIRDHPCRCRVVHWLYSATQPRVAKWAIVLKTAVQISDTAIVTPAR